MTELHCSQATMENSSTYNRQASRGRPRVATYKPTYANKAVPQDSSGVCSSSIYVRIMPDGACEIHPGSVNRDNDGS